MIRSSIRSCNVASAKVAIPPFNEWRSREHSALRTGRFHNPTPWTPLGEREKRLISTFPLLSARGGAVSANSRMSDQLQLPAARCVKWPCYGTRYSTLCRYCGVLYVGRKRGERLKKKRKGGGEGRGEWAVLFISFGEDGGRAMVGDIICRVRPRK